MVMQRDLHEGWTQGSLLAAPPDLIPDTGVRLLKNARIDRTRLTLSSRPGLSRASGSAFSAPVTALHKRFAAAGNTVYAQISSSLYRLPNSLLSSALLSSSVGTTALTAAAMVDGVGGVWIAFANGAVRGKDNGVNLLTMGIAAPTAAPSATALATDLSTTINACENGADYTGSGLSAGPTTEANIKQEGTNSVTFAVAANTLGSVGLGTLGGGAGELNLDTLSGGDSSVKADDYIHVWFRCDHPERIRFVQLDFDLNTQTLANAFRTDYYSIVLDSFSRLTQGANQWNKLQVRKAEFFRYGTTTSLSWANVKSARLSVQTTTDGAVVCYIDDWKLRGGTDIEGSVEYAVAYRNSSTGGRGNPYLDSNGVVVYTTPLVVDRQRVTVTITNVREGGANHPGDTQIDRLLLFRRINSGPSIKIVEMADTTANPYTDSITVFSTLLFPTLEDTPGSAGDETTNNLPPAIAVLFGGGASHRFFGLVGVNDLYFSKAWEVNENRIENWPPLNRLKVGTGSEQALVGIETDSAVLVWTTLGTYQVLGSGEDTYLAVHIPNSRPIVGRYAVDEGDGRVFFLSFDALYEHIGLQQLPLIDIGETLQAADIALNPDPAALATVRLKWHSDTHTPYVVLLIPTGSSTTPDTRLVIKRNALTGRYTDLCVDTTTGYTIQSLLEDDAANVLYGGGSDGFLYQLEDHTTTTDAGTGLAFLVDSKSYHQGAPQREKQYSEIVVEGNTNSANVTVTAYYDKRTTSEPLGTLNTSNDIGKGRFTPATPLTFHQDYALRFSGTVTQRITLARFGAWYEIQPEAVTMWDSGVLTLPFPEIIKRFQTHLNAPAPVTLQAYFNGIAAAPLSFLPTTERAYRVAWCPANTKVHTVRVTLTSPTAFRVYTFTRRAKPLGSVIGFTEQPMGRAA